MDAGQYDAYILVEEDNFEKYLENYGEFFVGYILAFY